MQKKIIALAIAAAVSAPAFAADSSNVSIYGVANVSYDITKNGAASANKVSSNASRIGLKGSEDLGGGLSAIWQVESAIDIDNSSAAGANNSFGTRNTFAGLSSTSLGTVLLGRHDTPYKIATRGLDVFADSIADNRALMGLAGAHDARATDVVAYISPAINGFTGAIAYVAGSEGAVGAVGETKGNAWSLAGLYNAGPINASLAYQTVDNSNTSNVVGVPFALGAGNKVSAWKIGGGYKMDAFTVNAAYEKLSSTNVAGLDFADKANWYLAGQYDIGSNAVKVAYTRAGDDRNSSNTGATQLSLGYDHALSKRTTLFAVYTAVNNEAGAGYGVGSAVNTGAVAPAALGNDPHAFSLGMKHTF